MHLIIWNAAFKKHFIPKKTLYIVLFYTLNGKFIYHLAII